MGPHRQNGYGTYAIRQLHELLADDQPPARHRHPQARRAALDRDDNFVQRSDAERAFIRRMVERLIKTHQKLTQWDDELAHQFPAFEPEPETEADDEQPPA